MKNTINITPFTQRCFTSPCYFIEVIAGPDTGKCRSFTSIEHAQRYASTFSGTIVYGNTF